MPGINKKRGRRKTKPHTSRAEFAGALVLPLIIPVLYFKYSTDFDRVITSVTDSFLGISALLGVALLASVMIFPKFLRELHGEAKRGQVAEYVPKLFTIRWTIYIVLLGITIAGLLFLGVVNLLKVYMSSSATSFAPLIILAVPFIPFIFLKYRFGKKKAQ